MMETASLQNVKSYTEHLFLDYCHAVHNLLSSCLTSRNLNIKIYWTVILNDYVQGLSEKTIQSWKIFTKTHAVLLRSPSLLLLFHDFATRGSTLFQDYWTQRHQNTDVRYVVKELYAGKIVLSFSKVTVVI
jgi:hypothetical protein